MDTFLAIAVGFFCGTFGMWALCDLRMAEIEIEALFAKIDARSEGYDQGYEAGRISASVNKEEPPCAG